MRRAPRAGTPESEGRGRGRGERAPGKRQRELAGRRWRGWVEGAPGRAELASPATGDLQERLLWGDCRASRARRRPLWKGHRKGEGGEKCVAGAERPIRRAGEGGTEAWGRGRGGAGPGPGGGAGPPAPGLIWCGARLFF